MKKFLSILLVFMMMTALVTGCAGEEEPTVEPSEEPMEEPDEEPMEEPLKVAVILPGPIGDGGWNASAYNGILAIQEKYGAEIAYNESTPISDYDEVFRLYASSGYDIVFGHGGEFGDAAMRVAPEFPDVQFAVTSTNIVQPPNVSSVQNDNAAQGFMQGVVAAVVSESGVVGAIGGMNIPSIADSITGFEAGAKYINPDIEVLTTLTGSFDDAAKAKEVANSMIEAGADIVMQNADHAGMGVIEAAEENGVYAIGSIGDQADLAPDTIIVSGVAEMPVAFVAFVDKYMMDDFEASNFMMGVAEGVIYLSPFYKFDDILTEEQKAKIMEVEDAIKDGSLVPRDYGDFLM
ncbi:BMP family protein [Clostridia bacterium]|nr:BMP family protein [Clostridia bacterium]